MPQSKNEQLSDLGLALGKGGSEEFLRVINHLIGKKQTATLVKVQSVDATGINPVGFVDVKPMVHQIDGAGNIVEMGTIFKVPYFRLQGGSNAVVCDPVVGDIGICLFASRDISVVKRTRNASAPASRRQYDINDGLYIGGVLNIAPSQYVFFNSNGIEIVSPTAVKITAPIVEINGETTINGNTEINGALSTNGNTVTLGNVDFQGDSVVHKGKNIGSTHTHSGITPGGSNTGGPN